MLHAVCSIDASHALSYAPEGTSVLRTAVHSSRLAPVRRLSALTTSSYHRHTTALNIFRPQCLLPPPRHLLSTCS